MYITRIIIYLELNSRFEIGRSLSPDVDIRDYTLGILSHRNPFHFHPTTDILTDNEEVPLHCASTQSILQDSVIVPPHSYLKLVIAPTYNTGELEVSDPFLFSRYRSLPVFETRSCPRWSDPPFCERLWTSIVIVGFVPYNVPAEIYFNPWALAREGSLDVELLKIIIVKAIMRYVGYYVWKRQ